MRQHVSDRYIDVSGRYMALARLTATLLVTVLLWSSSVQAARPRKKRARRPPVATAPATIPVEVAAGPILLLPNPPAFSDQPIHFGLQVQAAAIVDQALIRRYRSQIPAWARGYAAGVREVRVRPWWLALVPEVFVISPAVFNTGIYGGVWRPIGVNLPLVDTSVFTLKAGADLDLVGLFIHSSTLGGGTSSSSSYTVVIRPGVHLGLAGEVVLSPEWRVSLGWSSDLFVPQALGRSPLSVTPLEDSIWHLGGPFLMLHHRFEIPL